MSLGIECLVTSDRGRALDIARGILHEPRVLFLDEPTAGLDPRARRGLWEVVSGLRQSLGLTVFLTTHYVEEAEPCDRLGHRAVVSWAAAS